MAEEAEAEPTALAELVVRGQHVTEVDPEIAFVTTELSARARRREDVFERLRERAEWQRGVVQGFAEQIEREEMATHHVHPVVDRAASDTPVGYVGEIRTKITLKDLGCAGDLVSALSLGDMSEVLSLAWGLRPASPVHRAARIAAVHDAIGKARDYCAAIGSQIVGLLQITEPESGRAPAEKAEAVRVAETAAQGLPPSALFDFRPVPIRVLAEVDARFTIVQPKFG